MKRQILIALTLFGLSAQAVFQGNWAAENIQLEQAHAITKGAENIRIAILDTGIDVRFKQVEEKIELDPETGSYGYDFVDNDVHPEEKLYDSGTKLASLLVSNWIGIAPGARIIPIKIIGGQGHGTFLSLINGIHYAVQRKSQIILLPVTTNPPGKALCDAIEAASEAGILVIAAAGNMGMQADGQFCKAKNLMVVAASSRSGDLLPFSNWGEEDIDIAAPGTSPVYSFHSNFAQMDEMHGTSVAATITAGVAALLWSKMPELTAERVQALLVATATPYRNLQGKVRAGGVVNAYTAVSLKP